MYLSELDCEVEMCEAQREELGEVEMWWGVMRMIGVEMVFVDLDEFEDYVRGWNGRLKERDTGFKAAVDV